MPMRQLWRPTAGSGFGRLKFGQVGGERVQRLFVPAMGLVPPAPVALALIDAPQCFDQRVLAKLA
jgi:hypothetical protein